LYNCASGALSLTIFAHPLFANVADVIPAMSFTADEIVLNKGVWFTRAEHEKQIKTLKSRGGVGDGGVSPRTRSPVSQHRQGYFPASPLRERLNAEKELQGQSGDARRSSDKSEAVSSAKPSLSSSSLKEVRGLAISEDHPDSRSAGNGRVAESSANTTALGNDHPQTNGATERSDSQAATPRQRPADYMSNSSHNREYPSELDDPSRDHGISMRAGSSSLPVEEMKDIPGVGHSEDVQGPLSRFKFATSDVNEPVRTYDSQQQYSTANSNSRASAPMNGTIYQQVVQNLSDDTQDRPGSEPAIASEVVQAAMTDGGQITPTPSVEATSYTTDDRSEGALSPPHTAQSQAANESATSSPGRSTLVPTFSLTSDDSTSQGGSKNEFRTTVLSNGNNMSDEQKRNRKMSTKSVGARRSKLKMNLAFWKKRNKSDRSLPEEARKDDTSTASTVT